MALQDWSDRIVEMLQIDFAFLGNSCQIDFFIPLPIVGNSDEIGVFVGQLIEHLGLPRFYKILQVS